MPKRKSYPFRGGYKTELKYPSRRGRFLLPTHGAGPRCRVDHSSNDDGPWSTLQIMRVDENRGQVEVEEYTCAVPRYYAVPLILMNKRLAFFEASCRPDGTPLTHTLPVSAPTPTPTSASININIIDNNDNDNDDYDKYGDSGGSGNGKGAGVVMVTQRDLREYSYLWRLRTRFLQAIYDMNHQRRLDERWRYDPIHGFVHRLYRRYGHDDYQRIAYWRDEINAGRVPYTFPDIADMDWEDHIVEDLAAGTRINAFLWNRVSQGYPRVVKDEPPQEGWLAWRQTAAPSHLDDGDEAAAARDRDMKPALFRTPACTPIRELPTTGLDPDPVAVVTEQTQSQPQSQSQSQTICGDFNAQRADASPAAAAGTSKSAAVAAASGCCAGSMGRDDAVDAYEEVLTGPLSGPPHSRVWQLPFPASQVSQASQGTTSTSSQGRRFPGQIKLDLGVPEEMKLTVIHCIFSRVEDVGEDFEPKLKFGYAPRVS